jgi:hypothetical protein
VRLFSFCCQSLLPWPFFHRGCTWTRISSAHMWVTWQHEMGCCATQTTLIDVVHGGMFTCALLTSLARPSPLRSAGYTNDAAVTETSSAQTAFAGCLYDVHQPSSCRPKDPGDGGSTTIGFNWRCKACWSSLTLDIMRPNK